MTSGAVHQTCTVPLTGDRGPSLTGQQPMPFVEAGRSVEGGTHSSPWQERRCDHCRIVSAVGHPNRLYALLQPAVTCKLTDARLLHVGKFLAFPLACPLASDVNQDLVGVSFFLQK